MLLIGIDWADDHHDAAFMDEQGNILQEFRFTHDQDGFDLLHQYIKGYDVPTSQTLVALETKHGLLIHDLVRSGYSVYALNPKAVSRYRDRLRSSTAKDDKFDARTLANILRTDRHLHRLLALTLDDYRLMERLCNDLNMLINDVTRLNNRLLECLKEHYPAVIGSFGMGSDIFFAFLAQYPTPEHLSRLSQKEFEAFLKDHHYSVPSKATKIFEHLKRRTPQADKVAAAAGKMKVRSLIDQLVVLRQSRKSYEREIKDLLDNLPEADIISSLPGVGQRLLPEITALFGPNREDVPKRFENAARIAELAGLAPLTKQSGKFKSVSIRMACNHSLRRLGRHWAGSSVTASRWAKAFYDWQAKQRHSHETILRKLAVKWLRIAFHLWRSGQFYDEDQHIAQLKKHQVVWAMAL